MAWLARLIKWQFFAGFLFHVSSGFLYIGTVHIHIVPTVSNNIDW